MNLIQLLHMKKYLSLLILTLLLLPSTGSASSVYSNVVVSSDVTNPGNLTGAVDGASATFSSTSGWVEPGFAQTSNGDVSIQYVVDATDVYSMTVWFMNGASIEHTALVSILGIAPTGAETIENINDVTFDRIRIFPEAPLFGIDAVWIDVASEAVVDETVDDLVDEVVLETEPAHVDEGSDDAVTETESSHSEAVETEHHASYPRLIKLQNDGDPNTHHDTAVYAVDNEGKRRPFSGEMSYFSWFEGFDDVEELDAATLASFPLGHTMPVHHGTWLVKVQSANDVYAVEQGGVLRRIPDEATAELFYGEDWASRVRDIPPTDWPRYTVGDELSQTQHPNEFMARDDNLVVWHVRDGVRRQVPEIDLALHGIQEEHIVHYNAFETLEDTVEDLLDSYDIDSLYNRTDDFGWYDF